MREPAVPLPPGGPEWQPTAGAAVAAVAERPAVAPRGSRGPEQPRAATSRFLLTFLLLSAISSLPLILFETPSINDHANHMARVLVLENPEPYREFYEVRWTPLPNLAIDVLVAALASFLPVPVAGRVFLALVLLLLALGTATLHRQLFGRWALWPCASFACLYGRPLLSGTIGYLFGVGACLFAVAAWFALRRRPPWQRLSFGVPISLAIFFSHCIAFAIYGLVVFAAEVASFLSRPRSERRGALAGLVVTAAQGIPPLLILHLLSPSGAARFAYRSLWTRIEAFASPFIGAGGAWDFAMVGLLLAAVAWGLRTGRLRMPREIFAALVALTVAQLLIPNVIMTLEGGDRRLPIAAALLFFGGTRLDVRPGALAKVACVAFVLLLAARIARVADVWRAGEGAYADVRAAMAPVEPGSRVLTAFPGDAFHTIAKPAIAVYHLPVWETVKRGGFSPTLFAFPSQQPVCRTAEYERLHRALLPERMWAGFVAGGPEAALTPAEAAALRRYDYVVFVHDRPFTMDRADGLALVVDEPCAKLFRVPR